MVYIINNYDSSKLVSINDQTVNSTATSLRLPGRDYKPYGEVVVENLVWMLQNFSGTTPPLRAVEGQIWYDSASKVIKVYDTSQWLTVGKARVGDQFPTSGQDGELFYHTTKKQMFLWDLTSWKLIAPMGTSDSSDPISLSQINHTQWEALTVPNTGEAILKVSVGGVCVAIMSALEFTTAVGDIPGFTPVNIKPGINLNTTMKLHGTATLADVATSTLSLGGVLAANYMRRDQNNVPTTSGLSLGSPSSPYLSMHVETPLPGDASTLSANTQFVTDAVGIAQPVGVIVEYAGAAAPTGWLMCDGAAVSRSTYVNLYNVIGTAYGVGDGVNTFNVPDKRGRFGLGASGTYPRGSTGGSMTSGGTVLTVDQMPIHTHTTDTVSLTGTFGPFRQVLNSPAATGTGVFSVGTSYPTGDSNTDTVTAVEIDMDASHSHTLANAGGSLSHDHTITPPYVAVNYIIKT